MNPNPIILLKSVRLLVTCLVLFAGISTINANWHKLSKARNAIVTEFTSEKYMSMLPIELRLVPLFYSTLKNVPFEFTRRQEQHGTEHEHNEHEEHSHEHEHHEHEHEHESESDSESESVHKGQA